MRKIICVLSLTILFSNCNSKQKVPKEIKPRFDYVFDMVHDNPGEGRTESKYTNPSFVKEMGANGMIPHLHIQTAVDYSSYDASLFKDHPEQAKWVKEKNEWVKNILTTAEKEGVAMYPFTDFMVLPRVLLDKKRNEIVRDEFLKGAKKGENTFAAIKGKYAPDINKPLTKELLKIQLNEIFDNFPTLDGLTVRFGETYLFDTPHHSGGSPLARGGEQGIADHVTLINILKEEVCIKRNKKIFYRTWDFGFFHEYKEVYEKIVNQVEPHKNLIFSIKHQQGDFHRMTPFNPTLGAGNHPYIVEVCCQLDSYGKGAHPYYNGQGVIDGWEEYTTLMKKGDKKGIKDLLPDDKFKGVWTWSRGGGWQGPYIQNELWIDLNTQVVSLWAQNPDKTEEEVFKMYAESIGLTGENIDKFREIALLSAAGGLRGHCSLYATGKENDLTPWWTRDHFMYGQEMLLPFFERVIKENSVDKVLAEKAESVAMWKKIENLSKEIEWSNAKQKEYLEISSTYGRIKYAIFEEAWKVLLYGMQGEANGKLDKNAISTAINNYDALWLEWKALKENNEQCATLYYPHAWGINFEGVYPDVEKGMQKSVDVYRKMIQ